MKNRFKKCHRSEHV